ncbi:unnamed protein product [Prorocentrum cordatum]|uniref:Uncharacterized protein n=1 Tax=Prorocentrum cordatum TaxID=2364126 RepID=A0ABN9RE82_9DINO|nr:unnamed protein product [Polarella glacialis]|mmetsp:Transcript_102685/g.267984  ORF Transcript_102685/g.267984 Transcript_102685/m.267984 type:complete len:627 (-) Transcript_102685:236-2116(-)
MSEKRIDPEDGGSYTLQELKSYYRNKYSAADIQSYWSSTCKPFRPEGKGKKGKGTGTSKAKAEAKAKATAKSKQRGPANPKRFINDEDKVVQDCVDGLIWATPSLGRLDAFPDIKVVFRTDWNKDKVAIISGGGAGHEPMHGGFVGRGMLTAAISGETFASPTIDAVLSAIMQVTGPKGCLLVIKNYTGDRLNFTLAAQRAERLLPGGAKVEIVITKDDVATVAERGVAGTLFVHKVAGALAEQGASLEKVKEAAEAVIEASASMGVSLSVVRRLKPESIGIKKMEVGLGIHGEPGKSVVDMCSAEKVVEILMEGIMSGKRMQAPAPDGYACLINSLGNVPPQEMCVLTGSLMKSKWGETVKLLVGPALMCTSLDMNGVSLSLLRLTPEFSACLTADTVCSAWPRAVVPSFPELVKCDFKLDPMDGVSPSSDADVSAVMDKVCKALADAKGVLDELDGKVGDADCGSTMARAAATVLEAKEKLPLADASLLCSCLSGITGKSMGGSSGVLLSIMFMGMSQHLANSAKKGWAEGGPSALMAGLEAMMKAGGAQEGSRTMLDAFVPAAKALIAGEGFAGASKAAKDGAEATKSMAPKAGRTENVSEAAWKGVPDPGAQAVALVFAALA